MLLLGIERIAGPTGVIVDVKSSENISRDRANEKYICGTYRHFQGALRGWSLAYLVEFDHVASQATHATLRISAAHWENPARIVAWDYADGMGRGLIKIPCESGEGGDTFDCMCATDERLQSEGGATPKFQIECHRETRFQFGQYLKIKHYYLHQGRGHAFARNVFPESFRCVLAVDLMPAYRQDGVH